MLPAIVPPVVVNNIPHAVYDGEIADAAAVFRYVDGSRRAHNIPNQTLVDLVVSEHKVDNLLNDLR